MTPSKQQLDIYEWVKNGTGNLIVKARAGSGKTHCVVQSAQLMKGSVLIMAFNTKASYEIKDRLSSMALPNVTASTVHAAGKNIIYKALGWHKVEGSKVFYLTDKFCKTEELIKSRNTIAKLVSFAKQNAFGVKGQTPIDDTKAWMDIIAHHDITLDGDVDFYDLIEVAKKVLIDSNLDTKVIDFDDMQYLPLLYDFSCSKYDWVVVDEAQDLNVCRKLIAAKLLKDGGRLIAVGDEGQSCYGFTGAENDSMNLINEQFNCQQLLLTTCYRCGTNIIKAAQEYFPDIQAWEEAEEGSITSVKYQEFVDNALNIKLDGSVGIICRNNAPNVALAFALIRQGIGCRIEGREIGTDLLKLVSKWKRVKNLTEFTEKLYEFFTKEFEKASYAKLALLEDKLDTMIILIERVQSLGKDDLYSLETLIKGMFTDSTDKNIPNIVTLSSIHKFKGLERDTIYWLGNSQFSPSKYAILDWMKEQERNLQYIACTRARKALIHITDCPSKRSRED